MLNDKTPDLVANAEDKELEEFIALLHAEMQARKGTLYFQCKNDADKPVRMSIRKDGAFAKLTMTREGEAHIELLISLATLDEFATVSANILRTLRDLSESRSKLAM